MELEGTRGHWAPEGSGPLRSECNPNKAHDPVPRRSSCGWRRGLLSPSRDSVLHTETQGGAGPDGFPPRFPRQGQGWTRGHRVAREPHRRKPERSSQEKPSGSLRLGPQGGALLSPQIGLPGSCPPPQSGLGELGFLAEPLPWPHRPQSASATCPSSQGPLSRGDARSPPSRWSSREASSVTSTSPTLTPSGWWWPTAMVGATWGGPGFPLRDGQGRWRRSKGGRGGGCAAGDVARGCLAWWDVLQPCPCGPHVTWGQRSRASTRPGDKPACPHEDWGWASPYRQSHHHAPSDLNAILILSLPELHRPTESGGHPSPCRLPPEGLLPHADGQPGALSG